MEHLSRPANRRAVARSLAAGVGLSFAQSGSAQTPVASPSSTPGGIPIASPVGFDPLNLRVEDVLPLYEERVAELRSLGRHALDLFFAGEDDDLRALLAPAALEAFAGQSSTGILASFQTNRLQFTWPEVGASWDASFTGASQMTGFFISGRGHDVHAHGRIGTEAGSAGGPVERHDRWCRAQIQCRVRRNHG